MTRTQNSFFNIITGVTSSLLAMLLSFVTRTVFIRTLGSSYLGIEGYFSNILSVLNLANLGFGTAIIFKLYKPIEADDRRRIQVLMKLYRQVYFVVGCAVAVLGLCLIPFLPRLVRDYGRFAALGLSAPGVFLLYLFSTVSSYWFFAYKSSFVTATQKTYILSLVGYAVYFADCISKILVLVLTKNFIFYLLVQIFFIILQNILNAVVCDRRYPYLKERTEERVSKEELISVFKDCGAMMLHRTSNTVMDSTDNIVLTALVGLDITGLYANYLMVKKNLFHLIWTVVEATKAPLGSLHATDHAEWSRLSFRVVNFLSMWMFGVGAIGIAVLLNDFIRLWAGESYVVASWTAGGRTVSTPLPLLIGIEFYLAGQVNYCNLFRDITGTFQQEKFRPIASVLINLTVSALLVPRLGIAGCVIGTITAYLTTYLLFDPRIIWRIALKQSPRAYYLRNLLYKAVVIAAGLLSRWLCSLVTLGGIPGFIVRGCICVAVPCAVFALCYFRTMEFRFLLRSAAGLLARYVPALRGHDKGDPL